MSALLKTGVVVLPFLVVFLLIRACAQDEAARWEDRVREYDPAARIVFDQDGVIVIAPDPEAGRAAAEVVLPFRDALVANYSDLLGRAREQRMVIVQFSRVEQLQEYMGGTTIDPGRGQKVHGYTDPVQAAIFLPPSSVDTWRHETVHWVMAVSHGGTVRHSPWVMEGLAQLFERWEPGGRSPGLGVRDRAQLALHGGETIDVGRMLAMESYATFLRDDIHRNYREALVLTAFLFHERGRANLVRYVETERKSEVGRATAFRQIFGYPSEAFERDLRTFISRQKTGG